MLNESLINFVHLFSNNNNKFGNWSFEIYRGKLLESSKEVKNYVKNSENFSVCRKSARKFL